jgi:protein ImuA
MPPILRSLGLDGLRTHLRLLESPASAVLPFGDPRVDSCLAGGGLALGALHEVVPAGLDAELGAAGAGFVLPLLRRLAQGGHGIRGGVVWIMQREDLYGPGLADAGLDPDRTILIGARDDGAALAALEDVLRAGDVAAALAEVGRLDLTAARRLKLACERSGATALVLHRWPWGQPRPLRGRSGAAVGTAASRWRIAPAPSAPDEPGIGLPRWRVVLEHSRGGREGAWIMEADDATGDVRVVAELAAGAAAAPPLPARAVG